MAAGREFQVAIFRFFKVLVEHKEDWTHFIEKLCNAYHNN